MRRHARILLTTAGSVLILALLASVTGYFVAQSDWLREKLRVEVIEQAEKATGGRVEIGAFRLDWRLLTIDLDRLVIHGSEAAQQAPLLAVERATIGLRIISLFTRDIRLDRISVTHPRAHIIVDAKGGTNLPRPKTSSQTRTVDSILNLKIARAEVHDGEALVESPGEKPRILPWSGSARNLALDATYDRTKDLYRGNVSLAPVHLELEGYGPLDVDIQAAASMERNRVVVSKAVAKTAGSEVDLSDLTIGSFAAPVAAANYDARVSSTEAIRVLHLKTAKISGMIAVAGKARFASPNDFDVNGTVKGAGLAYGAVRNIRISGNLNGNQAQMTLRDIRANLLGGAAQGNIELSGYTTFKVKGSATGLGIREVAALGTDKKIPYDGFAAGTFEASGRLRDLSRNVFNATAQIKITPPKAGPPVNGEVSAIYTGVTAKLELGHSWIQLPNTRADVSGTLGSTLSVNAETRDLNDLIPLMNGRTMPFELRSGSASFAGTVTGALADPHIAGHAVVTNAVYEGRLIDSVAGDLTLSKDQANVAKATLTGSGITANGGGSISLIDWGTTDTSAITGSIIANNVDVSHVLDLAGNKNIPVTGTLNVNARVSGTLIQPAGNADVTLSKGLIYQQPYDSVTARVQYVNAGFQSLSGIFVSGQKRVTFDVNYPHAGLEMPLGTFQITASSNTMALNQIALVRQRQPDIEGSAEFKGTLGVRVTRDAKKALHAEITSFTGDGALNGMGLAGRNLGDAHFTARTQGTTMTANFDSDAAQATIRGEAKVDLSGDDRTTGSITFSNAGLNALVALVATPAAAKKFAFDGTMAGEIDFSGPLVTPSKMSATATVRHIEMHPPAGTPLATSIPGFSISNNGDLKVSLNDSVIRVEAARIQGPQSDLSLSGTAELSGASPLNLHLQGDINLAILRNFVPDLASSGNLALTGTVRGNWSTPDLSGHGTIHDGQFHYSDFTNGLMNATGEIIFSGTRATVQSFSAESGGGKVSASGFITLSGETLGFQITTRTRDVRVRYPPGVSSISDSDIQIIRDAQRSSISGTVTVRRLTINPQEDASAMLAGLSENVRTPATGDAFSNMNLDVLIHTAPDVALQSKLAQSIQADANLRLRGTVANPSLLGRINVSQGEIVFFGNKYTISQGSISFFNPTKIEPILNVDLETKARGVEVTLTLTGSPSHLNMTPRSDPPLEFADILALLATGRAPDDPSLALRGAGTSQSFEQLGASALLGEALANPVAGRLQRFFGVSRLKIDPQLAGATTNLGARLTVEQQITPDILFTYITDVSNTSQQLIRVEWAFNRNWSAILMREENGYVGLDFAFKKRFK